MSHGHAHAHAGHGHRDHAHGHEHTHGSDRGGSGTRVLVAAILTGGFMVAEAAGGLWSGSLALLADAGHMLTDAVALALAYVAFRAGERPGNSRLTYGFDRLKILVAYTNGLSVLVIAVWIGVEAAMRLASPAPVLGGAMLAIAVAGLLVNAVVFAVLHGGDRSSLNLRGAILHVLGDMLGSVAAIVAAGVILATGWTPADPLLSFLVTLLLLRSAWMLTRQSGHILLEGTPAGIDRNEVAADLAAHAPGVADIHHMHVWSLDERQTIATLHARLAGGADSDAAIRAIKARLTAKHGIDHATVEIETSAQCADEAGVKERYGTARR